MASQQISGITATDGAKVFAGTNTINNFNIGNAHDFLPCASHATFNAYSRQNDPLCLPGTRIEVLDSIREWLYGDDQRHIFWLVGWAGTGKSTIARTVAREVYNDQHWTASFFFSRGGGDRSFGEKFVSTLAQQLANKKPAFRTLLQEVISDDKGIVQRALPDQWRELIAEPISRLDHSSSQSPLIIIVDALDECQSDGDIWQILHFLADPSGFDHIRLRVLITSRPESHIREGLYQFLENSRYDLVLHDMSEFTVDRDIAIFLQHSLSKHSIEGHVIKELVRKSAGLFIWAATACRFIIAGKKFAVKRLDTILQDRNFDSAPEKHLDNIYLTVLKQSLSPEYTEREKRELCALLRNILGSIVVLLSPLSECSLGGLLALSEDVIHQGLEDCHSILDIPHDKTQLLRLHHPSFRDFLLDSRRCQDQSFWVDEQKAHSVLFERCVDVICSNLNQDICDVRAPGTTVAEMPTTIVNKVLLPEVQYACLYWVQHLLRAKFEAGAQTLIQKVLQMHFLHWIEALAWMQKISEAISSITALEAIIQGHSYFQKIGDSQELLKQVQDASRFIRYHRVAIESGPLQVYSSSLIFSPIESLTRHFYEKERPKWVLNDGAIESHWSPCLYALEGHSNPLSSISWSQNGSRLASASGYGTIKIWDPATGQCTSTLGHGGRVTSIAWSQDGSQLASASDDGIVRIWDLATGQCTSTLGHGGRVTSIAWSQDGSRLASASDSGTGYGTIKVWDPVTGQCTSTHEEHSDILRSITWLQDGSRLATTSDDKTVRIWDPATGQYTLMLEGHRGWISSISLSPDGSRLALASRATLRIWETSTGQYSSTLEGHSTWISTIAWSQDGSQLALASDDGTARIWDLATRQYTSTLQGHRGRVTSISWLQDGSRLASASTDGTVRIWDPSTEQCISMLQGHGCSISSISLSQDGTRLVSTSDGVVTIEDPSTGKCTSILGYGHRVKSIAWSQDRSRFALASDDGTVRIWDPATSQSSLVIKRHSSGWASSIAWSQDGSQLASASDDGIVRIWDLATSQCTSALGHEERVMSIAWSQDGSRLTSVSDYGTIKIWDLATGQCTSDLGHRKVMSISWSQDGSRFALASDDGTVRIWDLATSQCISAIEGYSRQTRSIAWLQDGSRFASASDDGIVRIWDPSIGQCTSTIQGHSGRSISWSQDGTKLALLSDEKTIKIFDLATRQSTSTLEGHSGSIRSISLSPDGSRLAFTLKDDTVKIWDPSTTHCTLALQGHSGRSISWSQDGSRLASASDDGIVRIWDPSAGLCTSTFQGHSCRSIFWSPDGSRLASASDDSVVRIWDPTIGQYTSAAIEGHSRRVSSISWSQDGSRLASASDDKTVRIWNPATGQCISTLKEHSDLVKSVVWSQDGSRLASASDDKTVRIWDPATGQCRSTLGHGRRITSIAWSQDGRLASTTDDATVRIWDPAPGQCILALKAPSGWAGLITWSQDGSRLAFASYDRAVRIWDLATRQCTLTLREHSRPVSSIAWSHDGSRLASASDDGLVRIWDSAIGKCTLAIEGHSRRVTSISWSQDGSRLASASYETVRIWDPATGQCTSTLSVSSSCSIRFDEDNSNLLHTGDGAFNLESSVSVTTFPGISLPLPQQFGYGFTDDRTWVTYQGKNLLWLPPDYRPSSGDAFAARPFSWPMSEANLAIGCSSGRVLILRLPEDKTVS
ncbi:hypothetical protein N7474_009368 [Penicillium riverlandense]|uniref:uncharacterized protein n=1 Tax=Penicillium riverlandense TaxID=1903569 RepID=UPI002548D735|nr:uncharacterized protein N7474_009368 [Penicillium riverlandense]KAJ5808099.1 hypothetical protein N7474_009368 [Penicillium riverlandense]